MATEARTLERLQYLEALYRQGYRSEVVDRSLEKLVARNAFEYFGHTGSSVC